MYRKRLCSSIVKKLNRTNRVYQSFNYSHITHILTHNVMNEKEMLDKKIIVPRTEST
jgi:hypothetical protein